VQWADISALNAMPRTWRRREHVLRITAEVNSLMLFSQRIDELRYSYERLLLLSDRSVCQDQKIAYSSGMSASRARRAYIAENPACWQITIFRRVDVHLECLRIVDRRK